MSLFSTFLKSWIFANDTNLYDENFQIIVSNVPEIFTICEVSKKLLIFHKNNYSEYNFITQELITNKLNTPYSEYNVHLYFQNMGTYKNINYYKNRILPNREKIYSKKVFFRTSPSFSHNILDCEKEDRFSTEGATLIGPTGEKFFLQTDKNTEIIFSTQLYIVIKIEDERVFTLFDVQKKLFGCWNSLHSIFEMKYFANQIIIRFCDTIYILSDKAFGQIYYYGDKNTSYIILKTDMLSPFICMHNCIYYINIDNNLVAMMIELYQTRIICKLSKIPIHMNVYLNHFIIQFNDNTITLFDPLDQLGSSCLQ